MGVTRAKSPPEAKQSAIDAAMEMDDIDDLIKSAQAYASQVSGVKSNMTSFPESRRANEQGGSCSGFWSVRG